MTKYQVDVTYASMKEETIEIEADTVGSITEEELHSALDLDQDDRITDFTIRG